MMRVAGARVARAGGVGARPLATWSRRSQRQRLRQGQEPARTLDAVATGLAAVAAVGLGLSASQWSSDAPEAAGATPGSGIGSGTGTGGRPKLRCLTDPEEGSVRDAVQMLLTEVRDEKTETNRFVFCIDRLLKLVIEVCLGQLASEPISVRTPTGATVTGRRRVGDVAAVSVLRSGDAFMHAFNQCVPGAPTGKLLVARHETAELRVLYSKLPRHLDTCQVLLMDPLLATGATMVRALEALVAAGAAPERITVVSLIACPDGIARVQKAFPDVSIVTTAVEDGLDANFFITPGLGSFGDRYFKT